MYSQQNRDTEGSGVKFMFHSGRIGGLLDAFSRWVVVHAQSSKGKIFAFGNIQIAGEFFQQSSFFENSKPHADLDVNAGATSSENGFAIGLPQHLDVPATNPNTPGDGGV